jgi:hypothetical protein
LVKLRKTSQRPSQIVHIRFFQPFPIVFHREVSMMAYDSPVLGITEFAEDLFDSLKKTLFST